MPVIKTATFSPCRRYRYTLWRLWPELMPKSRGYAMFIGLNPSTADEMVDDPTIRRCINFAKAWGYMGMCMTNLFALRATDPADVLAHADPVGKSNNCVLCEIAKLASVVVAAWGVYGMHWERAEFVRQLLPCRLHYLRLTKDGHPCHPLYLPKTLQPVEWVTSNEDKNSMGVREVIIDAGD